MYFCANHITCFLIVTSVVLFVFDSHEDKKCESVWQSVSHTHVCTHMHAHTQCNVIAHWFINSLCMYWCSWSMHITNTIYEQLSTSQSIISCNESATTLIFRITLNHHHSHSRIVFSRLSLFIISHSLINNPSAHQILLLWITVIWSTTVIALHTASARNHNIKIYILYAKKYAYDYEITTNSSTKMYCMVT